MKNMLFLLLIVSGLTSIGQTGSDASSAIDSGKVAYNTGHYNDAVRFFNRALQISGRNAALTTMAYNNLGNSYAQLGESTLALENYLKAIGLARNSNDTLTLAKALKNAGTMYSEQKDFQTAIQYYREAFSISETLDDPDLTADCLNNLGVVYEQQEQYREALDVYSKALAIYSAANDDQGQAMTLNNLAIAYKCLKNYQLAIQNYEASLAISQELGDRFIVSANQNNLGNVYALMGNFQKSLDLCLLSNSLAREISAIEIVVESSDGIASAYENLGDLRRALEYRKIYEKEKEAYINTERSNQLAQMQVQYETGLKETDIELLKNKTLLQNFEIMQQQNTITNRNVLLVVLFVFLLVLSGFAWIWKSRQELKNQFIYEKAIRDTEEQERLRIAKDIHDDLGSGLSKINFLSELIFQKTEHQPDLRQNSESVKETAVKMIGNMRDLIWALNPENTTLANLLSRIREYTTDYFEDYPLEVICRFPEKIQQSPITKEGHREIFMVVKETMHNIAKHAGATTITLQVRLDSEKLTLRMEDNGKGFDIDNAAEGNGLRNMQSRIQAIGGAVSVTSAAGLGTVVHMEVKMVDIVK